MADDVIADASLSRRTRAGRDHDPLRSHRLNIRDRDLVVAPNLNLRAEFSQVLHQVVGKRIVVVENKDHKGPSYSQFNAVVAKQSRGLNQRYRRLNAEWNRCMLLFFPLQRATPVPKGGIDENVHTRHSRAQVNATSFALE